MAGSSLRLPVRICRGPPWVCYDSGTYCTLSRCTAPVRILMLCPHIMWQILKTWRFNSWSAYWMSRRCEALWARPMFVVAVTGER